MSLLLRCLRALPLAGLGACSSLAVSSANLDAIHHPDGEYRYVAETTSVWRRALASMLPPEAAGLGLKVERTTRERIEDPAGRSLDLLLDLAGRRARGSAGQAAKVRHFAWLATEDPSQLARERCVLELGRLARRLAPLDPYLPPEEGASVPTPAGEAQLLEALGGLVEVATPLLEGGSADATARADLAAACELLASLELDLEGGRRVLRALEALGLGRPSGEDPLAPLHALALEVQRRLVPRALDAARRDPSEIVRAAAHRAAREAFGEEALLLELRRLAAVIERRQRAALPYAELEIEVLADLVRTGGLPLPEEASELEREELRLELLGVLASVAFDFTSFGDRARTASMRALGAVSGAGFESLRAEEWSRWWEIWRPEQRARLEALATQGATPPPPGGGRPAS